MPAGRVLCCARLAPTAPPARASSPFASLARAQGAARAAAAGRPGGARVVVRGGTYYLDAPLVFGPEDSGVTYAAYPGERVTLSGGRRLTCDWQPYRDGIWQCDLPQPAGA